MSSPPMHPEPSEFFRIPSPYHYPSFLPKSNFVFSPFTPIITTHHSRTRELEYEHRESPDLVNTKHINIADALMNLNARNNAVLDLEIEEKSPAS
ncbi:hypothetical protein M422DRAFT_39981, partial [Sphaerobolus stellatus SS14]